MLNRARVLLKADQGEHAGEEGPTPGDREIAGMLETSSATVERVRERFIRRGLDAVLERSMPDRAYERPFDVSRGVPDDPSLLEGAHGRDRRSMRLSADKAVELGIVRSVYLEEAARRRSRSVGLGDGA